jgi:hypothetical protein
MLPTKLVPNGAVPFHIEWFMQVLCNLLKFHEKCFLRVLELELLQVFLAVRETRYKVFH